MQETPSIILLHVVAAIVDIPTNLIVVVVARLDFGFVQFPRKDRPQGSCHGRRNVHVVMICRTVIVTISVLKRVSIIFRRRRLKGDGDGLWWFQAQHRASVECR